MGAKQREYKNRIKSTSSLKKIFSAQELIATSRIGKARATVAQSAPYTNAITRAVSAVATFSDADHPLIIEPSKVTRAAVLLVTSDRGMCGAYSANVLREGEQLQALLRQRGVEPVVYLAGRKASQYYSFRGRDVAGTWSGFSEAPAYDDAKTIGDELVSLFLQDAEEGGVDELHIVYTRFKNMVTQEPTIIRLLPLEVVDDIEKPAEDELLPLYEFEPNAQEVLDSLLPQYINSRVFNCMLQAAASEHAARQRAMKTASDNATDLINNFTRLANQARQAEITQEISEIVGGADALSAG